MLDLPAAVADAVDVEELALELDAEDVEMPPKGAGEDLPIRVSWEQKAREEGGVDRVGRRRATRVERTTTKERARERGHEGDMCLLDAS